MSARTRDPETTRAAILDAAENVFLANGFARATTSAISREAGVTKSLLHHHFGSKEGLWREVKQRRFQVYAEQQSRMLDESRPAVGLLRESVITFFNFMKANPELVRIMAWMYLEQDHDICEGLDHELTMRGVARLSEAQQQGLLRNDVNPASILFAFVGMVHHWFQDRDHYGRHFAEGAPLPDELDELFLQDFLKILMEGVLPR